MYSIDHTVKSQLNFVKTTYFYLCLKGEIESYLLFLQDLLSGKYYRDKADLRKQKMIANKIKNEKAMIKSELPSK